MNGTESVARDFLVVACSVSAGVHAGLAPAHLEDGVAAAIGFAASGALLAAVAVALTRSPSTFAITVAAGLLGGLLLSYAAVVTFGVPLLHPDVESPDGLALFTKAVEVVGLASAGRLRLVRHGAPSRTIPIALAALIAVFSGMAALAATGGHAHEGARAAAAQR